MVDATGETPLTRFLAGQTVTQLRGLKAQYREELDSIKNRSDVLEAELDRIDQALREKSGSRRRAPKGRTEAATNGKGRTTPALWQLIISVMGQRPGPWSRQEIFEALDATGRTPKGTNPNNVIGNRLLDLEGRGLVKRGDQRGTYELVKGMDRDPLFLGNAIQEAESEGT